MNFWHEVVIGCGNAKLKPDENVRLHFRTPDDQRIALTFKKAFVLESPGVGEARKTVHFGDCYLPGFKKPNPTDVS